MKMMKEFFVNIYYLIVLVNDRLNSKVRFENNLVLIKLEAKRNFII